MAISAANLTNNGSDTDATSYATASVSPTANLLELLAVHNGDAATPPPTPTVTGCNLTWVQVATVLFGDDLAVHRRLTLFRAMGASPTTGALTIDFAGATEAGCAWSLDEFTNADTSGTNGSGAIVQSPTNKSATSGVSSLTVTLSTYGDATNRGYSVFCHVTSEATTPRTNWTELADKSGLVSPNTGLETQWSNVAADEATASASWATSSRCGGIAVEIKAAIAGQIALNASAVVSTNTLALTAPSIGGVHTRSLLGVGT